MSFAAVSINSNYYLIIYPHIVNPSTSNHQDMMSFYDIISDVATRLLRNTLIRGAFYYLFRPLST